MSTIKTIGAAIAADPKRHATEHPLFVVYEWEKIYCDASEADESAWLTDDDEPAEVDAETAARLERAYGRMLEEPDGYKRKKRRLKSILKDHHCWWFRVLGIQQAWEFIIPFPLPEIVRFFLRRLSKEYDEKKLPWWAGVHSSLWMTLTIILSAYSYYGSMRFESARLLSVYAADASKTLFTAAFLLGTILSVSVALPGQAVIKSQIDRDPDFVFDFMAPFMWALMWGIIGGLGLSLVYYLTPLARNIAYVVGIYGACMELNALVHTIRMYMIGIILYYYEERNKNTDMAVFKRRRFITACLTRDGAERFISANSHRYNGAHVYVNSLYRNEEMTAIRQHLMDVAAGKVQP